MNTRNRSLVILAVLLMLAAGPAAAEDVFVSIGGGPAHSPFNDLALAVSRYVPTVYPEIRMPAEDSGGSFENVKRLHLGDLDFALALAGDVHLGAAGRLRGDGDRYDKVRPLAYIYGLPAHLVVGLQTTIISPLRLEGKKVAVGLAESVSAVAAQNFFTRLGLWDLIKPLYLDTPDGATALKEGRAEALWFVGSDPEEAVAQLHPDFKIRLLDLADDLQVSGFFQEFPFYAPATVAAGTYPGQAEPTGVFQDNVLLCANENVPVEVVYKVMKALFSDEGIARLRAANRLTRDLSPNTGFQGATRPLARGAYKFWVEKGVAVPEEVKPPDLKPEDLAPPEGEADAGGKGGQGEAGPPGK
ncbi:MAG: TAXI family TRAP transporter solute-binding subunit [Thermodesulfobacteriota bacterium]